MKQVLALLLAVALLVTVAFGQSPESSSGSEGELLDTPELQEVTDAVPPQAREQLADAGDIQGTVDSLQPQTLLEHITIAVREQLGKPLQALLSLVAIFILAAMLEIFQSTLAGSQSQRLFQVVVAVAAATVVVGPLVDCIQQTANLLRDFYYFITTYIPVMAGVMTAAGQPLTATAYNLFLFWICQMTSQLISSWFVPLLCAHLALTVMVTVCPTMDLGKLAGGIKTLVTWGLSLTLILFVGLLSVQSVVASSGDQLATRTAKFMIGSLIPGIGGALSDLFMAAQGCIQFTKNTLGAFGIVITLFTFLPMLVQVLLWYLSLNLASLAGSVLGVKELSGLCKNLAGTLGLLMAVLLYNVLLVIISTTLILVTFRPA